MHIHKTLNSILKKFGEFKMSTKKKFKILISLIAIIIFFIMLINVKILINSIKIGLNLCFNLLIPSMFMFLIICDFFQQTNALKFVLKPIEPIFETIFKIDRKLTSTLFFSLICGYPAGAILISNLLQKKQISNKTANRLICFCVNAGPGFLIGAVSIPLTNSLIFGFILFISQIMAFFVTGFLTSINEKIEKLKLTSYKKPNYAQIFVNSVVKSIKTMAIICGFAILFSAIINLILQISIFQKDVFIQALISGLIEVTNGINKFSEIENLKTFLAISLITSFGGLCVHCQIKAILSEFKISFLKFYLWRLVYIAISLLTSFILFKSYNFSKPVLAINPNFNSKMSITGIIPSIGLIILSLALLFCDKKNIIIKKKLKEVDEK